MSGIIHEAQHKPYILGEKPLWTVAQLPPLKVGDIFGFQAAAGFERDVIALEHAVTWHWAMCGMEHLMTPDYDFDYDIHGSISKGVATELLSTYQNTNMRVYRPRLPAGVQDSLADDLLRRFSYYGTYGYNYFGVGEAALGYFLRYLGIHIGLPLNHKFYCIQYVYQVWADLGLILYDAIEPVTPHDMENSYTLDKIWGSF